MIASLSRAEDFAGTSRYAGAYTCADSAGLPPLEGLATPRVLGQTVAWGDRYSRSHRLGAMDLPYLAAVIGYLEGGAEWLWREAKRLDLQVLAAAHIDQRLLPDPFDYGDAVSWLRATPLVQALYAEGTLRLERYRSTHEGA